MAERFRQLPLGEQHLALRAAFSCGEIALDRYLRERARKEMERRIAAVWILLDEQEARIVGYYTLSAVRIERTVLPSSFTQRMAKYEDYPACLIGRLAVDADYHGQRLGGRLLLDALARALAVSRQVASVAVFTDAKNPMAQTFYEHYGFLPLPAEKHEGRLFLPMETVEELFWERDAPATAPKPPVRPADRWPCSRCLIAATTGCLRQTPGRRTRMNEVTNYVPITSVGRPTWPASGRTLGRIVTGGYNGCQRATG